MKKRARREAGVRVRSGLREATTPRAPGVLGDAPQRGGLSGPLIFDEVARFGESELAWLQGKVDEAAGTLLARFPSTTLHEDFQAAVAKVLDESRRPPVVIADVPNPAVSPWPSDPDECAELIARLEAAIAAEDVRHPMDPAENGSKG